MGSRRRLPGEGRVRWSGHRSADARSLVRHGGRGPCSQEGTGHLRCGPDTHHRPRRDRADIRVAPLRDAPALEARQGVPGRRERYADRHPGEGLRRDGALRACKAQPGQPGQHPDDRPQLRRFGQPGPGPEDDPREVRGRPRRCGQGRDRQGPVHHRHQGRPAQGHLDGRTRGSGFRPPGELPPVQDEGPAPGRPRLRELGCHR